MIFKHLFFILLCILTTKTFSQDKMTQPPYLKVGDTIAIVAPSGALINKEDKIEQAITLLKSWGLHVVIGEHVFNVNNHFAGTDDERCEDYQKALDDPSISAILCARGGYGTVRILDKLNYSEFKKHPKWLIGYSDITALHNQLQNEGFESIHGLMCASMQEDLHTMLGSKTSIDTSGKILFIEEIGEYKYHIDRMLQSLKRAGYFDNCKGLIVGDISNIRKNTTEWGSSIEQLILDALSEYDFPIAFNMHAGHEDDNRSMIFGRTVDLIVGKNQSTFVFEE
jgi:muramoyltetrapeptide carboxypeptidase